jgi:hypothetical protein
MPGLCFFRIRLNLFPPGDDTSGSSHRELPVMNPPEPAVRPARNSSPARRIAVAITLGALVFAALWVMMFSLVASLLIGTGCCAIVVAASSVSDLVEALLDAIASVIFGVLALIAAVFGAIFGLFGS